MIMIDISQYIDFCLVHKDKMSHSKLAELTEQSPQVIFKKFKNGTFKLSELEKIANALNADLQIKFIDRDTHLPIGEQEIKQTETAPAISSSLESTVNQINDKLGEICGILRRKEMELEF